MSGLEPNRCQSFGGLQLDTLYGMGHSQFMFSNNNVQVDETIRVRKFSLFKVGTCRYSKLLMKMYEIVKETTCIFIIFIANIHKVSE